MGAESLKMLTFNKFKKMAEKHGLQARECKAEYHWQIIGGALIVNYYPTSKKKTVYVNGATNGKSHISLDEAIKIAKGDYKKPVSNSRSKRKTNTRSVRKRLWKPNQVNRCFRCKLPFGCFEETTLEHRVPLAKGGSNRLDNLALSHEKCNKDYGNQLPKAAESFGEIL